MASKTRSRARERSTPDRSRAAAAGATGRWTFLSNHAHVLICLAGQPDARMRDLALRIGITERAVQRIVLDLEVDGLIVRHREGRRNVYELHLDQPLRHPVESHRAVRELVELILEE